MSASIIQALRAAGCVFAEDEARLLVASASTTAELEFMVNERRRGIPLEHIVGWVRFRGLRIALDPGVFVPRRRTELLVDEAARRLRPRATVVDLGCGSGAIGAALRCRHNIELYAVDIDPAAVKCAQRNLAFPDEVLCGDLYQPLPVRLRHSVDVIVANTPYVPTDAIAFLPAEARLHEDRVALDGGVDGLDVARRVIAEAPRWLAAGGHLLIETSEDQAQAAASQMRRRQLTTRISRCPDMNATVVIGRLMGD